MEQIEQRMLADRKDLLEPIGKDMSYIADGQNSHNLFTTGYKPMQTVGSVLVEDIDAALEVLYFAWSS